MLKKCILAIIACFLWVQGSQADNVDPQQAQAFMNEIGETVINLLTNKSISDQDRAQEFQKILESSFDIKAAGKFVLGRYWNQASDGQKQHFLELFKATTVASYATRFKEYTSERFDITGSRIEGDGGVTVLSNIVRPQGDPISIGWKIFTDKNGNMRIYDVILEGISMGITLRSEYASVIQQGGGTIQALIDALEKKMIAFQETH